MADLDTCVDETDSGRPSQTRQSRQYPASRDGVVRRNTGSFLEGTPTDINRRRLLEHKIGLAGPARVVGRRCTRFGREFDGRVVHGPDPAGPAAASRGHDASRPVASAHCPASTSQPPVSCRIGKGTTGHFAQTQTQSARRRQQSAIGTRTVVQKGTWYHTESYCISSCIVSVFNLYILVDHLSDDSCRIPVPFSSCRGSAS